MTTVGTATWGVIISSGNTAGVPSDNIVYLFSDSVKRKLNTKDKITHMSNWVSYHVPLKQHYYTVDIEDCIIAANAMATLNSYHALLVSWLDTTPVYFWAKGRDGNYMDFIINGSTYDYLKGLLRDPEDALNHKKYKMNLKFEQCDS
jgi:hypothetical protein